MKSGIFLFSTVAWVWATLFAHVEAQQRSKPEVSSGPTLEQSFEYSAPLGDEFLGIPSKIIVTVEFKGQKELVRSMENIGVERNSDGQGIIRFREKYYDAKGQVIYAPEVKVLRGLRNICIEETGEILRTVYDYTKGAELIGLAGSAKVFDRKTNKLLATHELDASSLSKAHLELDEKQFDENGKIISRARVKLAKMLGKVVGREVIEGEQSRGVYIFAWPTMTYGGGLGPSFIPIPRYSSFQLNEKT